MITTPEDRRSLREGVIDGVFMPSLTHWVLNDFEALLRTNGRRERHILRARLQDAGAPVTPEWLGDVEMIYPEARVTQRLCSALRRAWDERDKARASVARVEALAEQWEGLSPTICGEMVDLAAVIRVAINKDVPHGR